MSELQEAQNVLIQATKEFVRERRTLLNKK